MVPADNLAWTERTWRRVREEVDAGHRAYVVCPRIDGDDPVEPGGSEEAGDGVDLVADDVPVRPLRAVTEVVEDLRARPVLADVPIGVLHGRMTPEEKDRTMADFASGRVPVLVSTTVIEVGVDVPEATVMVVLDADRFGLSQLHQLRGRVGRGADAGLCLLVSHAAPATPAGTRLTTLAETTDGFVLASVDLELRREGDVLGAAQSGAASSLRLLRVTRDGDLIARARADARRLVDEDPTLATWPALVAAIDRQLEGEREEFLDRS